MTSEETFPEIGQRLCAARLGRGFSQGMLARRAGISASYLSRIENGRIQPTFRTVLRLLRGLNLGLDEVFGAEAVRGRKGACPVSAQGSCLLDLIRPETEWRAGAPVEHYTPKQIKLLRRLATWMTRARPDRIRAMDLLVEDLIRGSERD